MKKIIPIIIIIVIVSLLLVGTFFGTIVKKGVETVGPQIAGVPITLENASVSALGGTASLENLVIKNPKGFKSSHAFSIGNVGIDLDVASLMSDTIIINAIYIHRPSISYEIGLGGTNINTIANNITKNSASTDTAAAEEPAAEKDSASAKKVVINNIYIKGAEIQAGIGENQAKVSIPEIHLKDIGKEKKGTSFADASKLVITAITKEIAQADLSSLMNGLDVNKTKDAIVDGAKDKLKDATKGLKDLF